MEADATTIRAVQEYYGRSLRSTRDLRTSACCAPEALPKHVRDIIAEIDAEVLDRFYGCGSPIPQAVQGCTVLDLGCGTGRDVFVLSRLVGPSGKVIGVDVTEEQLDVARRHVGTHQVRFGFERPNVAFHLGDIEDLESVGIADNSVDVVISNCVINLASDKRAVFREILRVLKPGGELLFSDVFADRRIPDDVKHDPVLYGECLGGALYVEDFRRMLTEVSTRDYRVTAQTRIELTDDRLADLAGNVTWTSMTVRTFNLPETLEDRCEDYGQIARYLGTIPHAQHRFVLDDHHEFPTGKPVAICGNTASMLSDTRYARHFEVIGDRSRHYGLFDCGGIGNPDGPISTGSCC